MVRKQCIKQVLFVLVLVFSLVPLFIFSFRSYYAHQIYQFPALQDGVLDLAGYDLSERRAIPLDGSWEFFSDQWIITDGNDRSASGVPSQVPRNWSGSEGIDWHTTHVSSYRITLKNCPEEQEILCYIPNICANYRVFLNGTLIASRGLMQHHDKPNSHVAAERTLQRFGLSVPPDSDAELVIELLTPQVGGLYMTPILTEANAAHYHSDRRTVTEAVFIGIIITALFFIVCLQILRDNLLASVSLLLLDFLVFFRILIQNDRLSFLQPLIPVHNYTLNVLLQTVSLFLPVILLLCVRKLIHMQISKRSLLLIAVFELLLAPLSLFFALAGRLGLSQLICVISFFPFLYVTWVLYLGVGLDAPYALLISSALVMAISSIVAIFLDFSGWLVMRIDLYPPAMFALSMLVQLWISIRHTLDLQKQAMEAQQLRLQLRESALDLRLSQIKPHFLYNTLLAIHVLCTEAPETAAETTLKFADFLRTNMNFIETRELIPFEKELAHVQKYTDIELLRFQRRLTVRFDIRATDFFVPPLSIQPLVDNAIKHGACKNVKGGNVTLSTREEPDSYLVEIADDGPGFDPDVVLHSSDSSHGLPNILYRLREQRDARVEILSAPGRGTQILIHIPKEEPS